MPSTLPSSFASAAAGNGDPASGARNTRPEGSAFADWSRRPNGATQTFRRTSTATSSSAQAQQREITTNNGGANTQNIGVYVPPHITASRNGAGPDMRYAKTQLLDLFREQRDSGDLENGVTELYVGDIDVALANGTSTNRWSRREEQKNETAGGTEACWERGGGIEPMGLFDLTEEEKELLNTSVNSTIKATTGPAAREGTQRESAPHRKLSVSLGNNNPQALATASPTATRPSNRRREPSESYPFPNQPTGPSSTAGKPARDDSGAATSSLGLLRRKTDLHESEPESTVDEREDEYLPGNTPGGVTPFGTVKRRVLPPISAGLAGPSSPWGPAPPSAGFSPMGAFSGFGVGGLPSSGLYSEKQPHAGLARSESRFKGLMSKSSIEETSSPLREKSSFGLLGRQDLADPRRRSPQHMEDEMDDPGQYVGEGRPYGSAALGGGQDESLESLPSHNRRIVDNNAPFAGHDADSEDRNVHESLRNQPFSRYHQTGTRGQEPQSPTFTNPYQSPHQQMSELRDAESDDVGMEGFHLPGLGAFQGAPGQGLYSSVPSEPRPNDRTPGYDSRYFERGLPPTTSASRGFPSLGGLGGLAGLGGLTGLGSPGPWSNNNPIGTPTRERGNMNDLFSEQRARTPSELQSPSVAGHTGNGAFGAVGGFGYGGSGTAGRSSKLGSLFPPAMQEQMRTSDHAPHPRDAEILQHDSEGFDDSSFTSGSNAFGVRRDVESPMRSGRGKFDEFFGNVEKQQAFRGNDTSVPSDQTSLSQQYSPAVMHAPIQTQGQQTFPPQQQTGQRVASLSSSASNQPPAAQQKTMVMPDRIRWIYRDPQGNTQGPWSGLEMHDWYRAGFFSPELLVKKVEDADYEPLAQLIRRIGNSREPFLVPQIGIPGPPTSQAAANWPNQTLPPVPAAAASATQPPFAGSFPSFGTTLTADQQNALERRKQEEQYLMARQKEHLAQQQILVKQMQMQGQHGLHPQLHSQASAQSLHSQPSFGSITSPGGFQASPIQGINHLASNLPAGYDSAYRMGGGSAIGAVGTGVDSLGHIREEAASFDRQMQFSGAQAPIGQQRESFEDFSENDQRISNMLADRARLAQEQEDDDEQQNDSRDELDAARERLHEFRKLSRELDAQGLSEDKYQHTQRKEKSAYNDAFGRRPKDEASQYSQEDPHDALQSLSLTEQVQKAASAKQSPLISLQAAWAGLDTTMLETLPPPQSASPLPAPAARRNRSHVADALAAESRSQSNTPSVETPTVSLAPWAQQTTESHKQPSLKEIQEAEARRAAKQEEIAAAARRALLEKELASATAPAPVAPGLPLSSTWARTESPVTVPSTASSAWAKSAAAKTGASGGSTTKKTMQQIVQEEEALARKKKAALAAAAGVAAAGAASGTTPILSTGKRYADLAGKAASPAPGPASAWTTVGAGGKTKAPAAPIVAPAAAVKVGGAIPTAPAAVRPKVVTAASKTSLAAAQLNAHEEFKKWAIAELRPDLHKDIQVDDFVQNLLNFPSDTDLITEAVHMSSRTVDSRHFAEEFVRRRGLAEKGKTEPASANVASGGAHAQEAKGGWSEVAARKGSGTGAGAPQKEESGAFKIVAAKKKGGKK